MQDAFDPIYRESFHVSRVDQIAVRSEKSCKCIQEAFETEIRTTSGGGLGLIRARC